MKLTLPLIIVFLLSTGISSGQNVLTKPVLKKQHSVKRKKTALLEKMEKEYKIENDGCIVVNKYSPEQRLKRYPFSKAIKIAAVSYRFTPGQIINPEDIIKQRLHIKDGLLDTTSILEFIQLGSAQTDSLTQLIFNTIYLKTEALHTEEFGACFNPRNSILFYNDKGKIFEYITVCFECQKFESSNTKLNIGDPCTQKYELLRKFFMSIGIKNGV
ncbi:hypothetical protein [Pedobacter caeni]|uniref:Uncharacterized protein n=1 Tax=Pedobacter caeni TaxID=288992 RepID=A0A1M4VZV2_9SPHI|nr:hypothetical protein [Pedobacter caeni]SHE74477.1 hypothetical protein SAMN04488522_1011079 [Pedobacter caeni]